MNYPRAFITLIVSKTVYPLAEHCPYVNEVLIYDMPPAKNFLDELVNATNFSKKYLWKRRYSVAFSIRYWQDNTAWLLPYLSGAVERAGYSSNANSIYFGGNPNIERDIGSLFFTHTVIQPKEIVHDVLRNLYVLKSFGLQVHSTDLEIWFDSGDLYEAKKILEGFAPNRVKISVGIGAGRPERKYPVEKYLVAFKEIINKGAAIIIFGGSSEIDDAKFLENNLPKKFVKNMVELKAGWRVDAAVMSLTDVYIGNFTGACDMAGALKKLVIALSPESPLVEQVFEGGYSQYAQYYPFGTTAIILRPVKQIDDCAKNLIYGGCKAGKSHCIAQISPSFIVEAYDKILKL